MSSFSRMTVLALALATTASLPLSTTVTAQVASLLDPDASPTPDAAKETELDFLDREEALLAYAQCLRDNGIDMADPQVGEGGRGFLRPGGRPGFDAFGEEFLLAQEACGPILEAARPDSDPEAEQERLDEQLALAECLRESGFEAYPDPVIGSDGRLERGGGRDLDELGIDFRSEEFQGARQACADTLGIERAGPGFGPALGSGS